MIYAAEEPSKRVNDPIPPERYRHDELVNEETLVNGAKALAKRVVTQTPLDRYYRRNQITEKQHKAGSELFDDWYLAGLEPTLVPDLTKVRVDESRATKLSESRAWRRDRFRRAMLAVGIINSNAVVTVCCNQRPAGSRHNMRKLRRGLDTLAKHYGY